MYMYVYIYICMCLYVSGWHRPVTIPGMQIKVERLVFTILLVEWSLANRNCGRFPPVTERRDRLPIPQITMFIGGIVTIPKWVIVHSYVSLPEGTT